MRNCWILAGVLVVACGPSPGGGAGDGGSATDSRTTGDSQTSGAPTSGGVTSSATSNTTSSSGTTTGGTTDGPTSSWGSSGADFITPLDACGASPGQGARCTFLDCDPYSQDCPNGEACKPSSFDGVNWDHNECFLVDRTPKQKGDPCTVEGNPVSGEDDCDVGLWCFYVDQNLQGACVELCGGFKQAPTCSDPDEFCSVFEAGVPTPCLPHCDPLGNDCGADQTCQPIDYYFGCLPDGSRGAGEGDGCASFNACPTGLICAPTDAQGDCNDPVGCCAELCDLSAPVCAKMGATCTPVYDPDPAPEGLENLGVCLAPP